ncbi:MAG: hypothetical protein HYT80_04000 [Euryarchaeota archaeon]|nr:hypothetical protein [Euryarchaeota archaeon]
MNEDDLARLVEFKLLLSRITEDHLFEELRRAANAQGRRLPNVTRTALRTGASAAVRALSPAEILTFAQGATWEESLKAAVDAGAWRRLLDVAIRLAFPSGPA